MHVIAETSILNIDTMEPAKIESDNEVSKREPAMVIALEPSLMPYNTYEEKWSKTHLSWVLISNPHYRSIPQGVQYSDMNPNPDLITITDINPSGPASVRGICVSIKKRSPMWFDRDKPPCASTFMEDLVYGEKHWFGNGAFQFEYYPPYYYHTNGKPVKYSNSTREPGPLYARAFILADLHWEKVNKETMEQLAKILVDAIHHKAIRMNRLQPHSYPIVSYDPDTFYIRDECLVWEDVIGQEEASCLFEERFMHGGDDQPYDCPFPVHWCSENTETLFSFFHPGNLPCSLAKKYYAPSVAVPPREQMSYCSWLFYELDQHENRSKRIRMSDM